MTEYPCPALNADVKEDMRLSALDAWRMDGTPATLADLETRYGFTAGQVQAHGADALAWAMAEYERNPCLSRAPAIWFANDQRPESEWRCQGARDGECLWPKCPQIRDGEPAVSGRHCPLDRGPDNEI